MGWKAELAFKGFEMAFGVVAAFAAYSFCQEAGALAAEAAAILGIVVGLTAAALATSVTESVRQTKSLNQNEKELKQLLRAISEGDPALVPLRLLLRYGYGAVPRERVPLVWIELLWSIKESWLATNYVDMDDVFYEKYGDLGTEIQRVKRRHGKQIQRIFIVDDVDDMKRTLDAMKWQQTADIDVRWITKDKATQFPLPDTTDVEAIDFMVVDSLFVFAVSVDKDRRIKSGRLLFEKAAVQRYKALYDAILQESKLLSELPIQTAA